MRLDVIECTDDDTEAEERSDQIALLWRLLGRPIAFHRRLVEVTGAVKAALMLSQTIYWTQHGRDIVQNDGWFYKSAEQWWRETCLTRHEQASARSCLVDLGLIDEQCRGVPATLHFRIDLGRLAAILAPLAGTRFDTIEWGDQAAIAQLLGPVVAFHRVLAATARGVTAGLFLSRAVYLTRKLVQKHQDGWMMLAAAAWHRETGLTPREQERARRELREAGVWHEWLAGVPPRLRARVCLANLVGRLHRETHVEQSQIETDLATPASDGGFTANRFSRKRQTGWRNSHFLILRKPANLFAGKRKISLPENAKLYVQETTSTTVLQPPQRDALAGVRATSVCGGCEDLIFPESLLREERELAAVLLREMGGAAQTILDELAARLSIKAIRTSPIGYLRGLISHAKRGTFTPELGLRIAAAREQQKAVEIARGKEKEEEAARHAAHATPEYQQQLARRREDIHTMIEALRRPEPPGKPS